MIEAEAKVGTRIRTLRAFVSVPEGTEGVIDEDYETGVMVAWDLKDQPLPDGYHRHDGRSAIQTGFLRDGFDKQTELQFLERVNAH